MIELAIVAAGVGLIVAACAMDQPWFDRHFLSVFFLSRALYVLGEQLARCFVALCGLSLILARRPLARRASSWSVVSVALVVGALLLALVASEFALRMQPFRPSERDPLREEPLRRADPLTGWAFVPSRDIHMAVAGRTIRYTFDAHGFRVPDPQSPVDPTRPSILFAGESIMMGYGLNWEETVPARVAAHFGTQPANMAVFGYADDQNLIALRRELPRFSAPKAVIVLFAPGLLFRDFNDDRPHLDQQLVWRPAVPRWRLSRLLDFYIPYHRSMAIDAMLDRARRELREEVGLARARGADVLVVVPHYGPEDPIEHAIRARVLDAGQIPYVWVQLDAARRLPNDLHPDPRGAAMIAAAISDRLDEQRLARNAIPVREPLVAAR